MYTENGLELADNFNNYDDKTKELVLEYLNQLTQIDYKAYNIAKQHLGTSFNVARSNGFHEWKKEKAEREKREAKLKAEAELKVEEEEIEVFEEEIEIEVKEKVKNA